MEEISRVAVAYYKHLPDNKKEEAKETFNAMDKNRDEKINRDEYLEYLKKDNNTVLQSFFKQEYLKKYKVLQSLFTELDKDGNGLLDFNEAIVLYYIMQSGRAIICKGCDSFLAGAYFSCSQCFFNDPVSTYDLCCDCYGDKKFVHDDGHTLCDNYTLLRQSRSPIQAALIKSGRVIICKGCDSFLAGAYFSCSQCFFDNDDSVSTFDVCCDCYSGKNFRHNDGHIFCDNYTLLSRSRSVIQEAPIKKRILKVLNNLKKVLQFASNSEAVEDDINHNQRARNEPADGLNQKDLLRKIFYAMNLLLEMATAVLDYVSSQQRQPRYALSSMILSITVMAISLIQLAYTGRKEEVSWQWKGWIPWFYHPDPSNKLFGNPVQIVELFFSVSQCVFAIIAYHYLSRDQNNPTQFSVYPIVFAFFLLCLSFRRREPRVKVSEKI